MLLGCLWVLLGIANYRHQLARLLFRPEDPRPVAALRIALGILLLLNINGMADVGVYLFTDEGLFTTDVARHLFGRAQYAGIGDGIGVGEPRGFFDLGAVWRFLAGPKFSLLFFWDSPTAYWVHLGAFNLACLGFVLGYRTRAMGVCTLLLFHSLYLRNYLFWEGEDVYRTFLLYLCFARCGHAYSLDNWLRHRRQRRSPDPEFVALRPIPSWPRVLMIAQLGLAYSANGCAKTGPVWSSGEAIYYLLNVDHFSRFTPQVLAAELQPLLRVLTWMVRYWEALFFLVVVGWVMKRGLRGELGLVPKRVQLRGRWLWGALAATALAIAWLAMPAHLPVGTPPETIDGAQLRLALVMGSIAGLCLVLAARLRGQGRLWGVCAWDLQRWVLGRRVWLGFGLLFHLGLFSLCNIGWFGLAHLAVYLVLFEGHEIEGFARHLLSRFWAITRLKGSMDPEPRICQLPPPPLDHPGPGRSRPWAVGFAGVGIWVVATIFMHLHDPQASPEVVLDRLGWPMTPALVVAAVVWVARREPAQVQPGAWAYGPRGRLLVSMFLLYHCAGVLAFNLPDKACLSTWRKHARAPFRWWIQVSQTDQYWRMMAPNAPQFNVDLRVRVRDQGGQVHDLHTDVYSHERWPPNKFVYTRDLKLRRRVAGEALGPEDWYQAWHARYVCRQWALDHGGELAQEALLVRIRSRIPPPTWVQENGSYDPLERVLTHGIEEPLLRAKCQKDVRTYLPNFLRRRHGLSEVQPEQAGLWPKGKHRAWEKAKAAGETPGPIPWRVLVVIGIGVWVARQSWPAATGRPTK